MPTDRQNFYDAMYGAIRAADNPAATTVPSPRGPLPVHETGWVRAGDVSARFIPRTAEPSAATSSPTDKQVPDSRKPSGSPKRP
jgi:hypothetical protein